MTNLPTGASLSLHPIGSEVLTLSARGGTATIALFGATVLSFTPASGKSAGRDLLWVSPKSSTVDNKPIRGGVPLCGPWFGPHPTLPSAPGHGLLRIRIWDIVRVETLSDGRLRAELSTELPAARELGWPHTTTATFTVIVGSSLWMELSLRNTGTTPFLFTGAMHTYFSVSDVRKVRVEGLDDREYIDFTPGKGARRRHGKGPVEMTGEAAHFFLSSAPVSLVDEAWGRLIALRSWGSGATVVWNPWDKTASGIADIGTHWHSFLCVENARIHDLAVCIQPDTTHHLGAEISVS